ncbi:DUF4255 domain-containing protein [Streptomyces sp. NBC_01207]|uniref:DUF4255 domain-containing protein n=1 Tax=Streptomyces sp. NBC_01207 TaxID=2903772 RepID=UPI002E0FF553|nr:DUF4255 domain-containing protein [Streptomyces sp. NBC_01207]
MSDARAIEAVTETLRALVGEGIRNVPPAATVVAKPLDKAAASQQAQVNLFLYQTGIAPGLRNDPPAGLGPGETGEPALPLVLRYLLTPFVPDGDDLVAHRLLGHALQMLHTVPVLTRGELAQAGYSDVARQVDGIRITWHAVEEKDIYSLWSVFHTPYRLSAAFEVRAVLIDSKRAARTPLPVLKRGTDGRGPQAAAHTRPTTARIDAVRCPAGRPAARIGDRVELHGVNLSGVSAVRLTHLMSGAVADVPVPAAPQSSDVIALTMPGGVPAGVCAVTLMAGSPPAELPVAPSYLAVAPKITSPMPVTVTRDSDGNAGITLTAAPPFSDGQQVLLLLGGDANRAHTVGGDTAEFTVKKARPGDHRVRLRVDGVDSLLVFDHTVTPPAYDPTQLLTVT